MNIEQPESPDLSEPSSTNQFSWVSTFADLQNAGCAVVSTKLDIVFASNQFRELLNIDIHNGSLPTFFGLIEIMANRGDFGEQDPEAQKANIYRALDDQISGRNPDSYKLQIRTTASQLLDMSLKALPDHQVLILVSPAQDTSEAKPHLYRAMKLGDTGYCCFYPKTGEFQLFADAFFGQVEEEETKSADQLKDFWKLVHTQDKAKAQAAVTAVMNSKRKTDINLRINSPFDTTVWVRTRIEPVLDKSGEVECLIGNFTDITQTLRVHNQLRESAEKSEKALRATTSFLGRLSHEIRTPMNAVIGISDALIHHHGDPTILPKLELIQTSAEKIVRIVDETLQHTKLDEDKIELDPTLASPRKCIEAACQLWEPKTQKDNIELSYQIDPSVPEEIMFDSLRYEQCLNNLLSNAVKFSPGGKIQVVLTTLQKDGTDQLVLVVKDSGIGMTPEQQATIFDPFTQADKSISGRFGGTGLGMHITKRMIELMGGKITMRSEPEKGSVFALTMPIVRGEEMPEPAKSADLVTSMLEDASPNHSDYANLTVLVADDNQTNHMVISSLLGSVVKDIHVAENGQEAIDILANTPIDIVLMDIHMPVMDGIEATLSIRGSTEPWSEVPIIALTADPQYQQKRLCKNIGMDTALAKPVKLTEILAAIDAVYFENAQADAA